MAYRHDEDLKFLASVPSSDLNDLVKILTEDKDGKKLKNEEITENEEYIKYFPDHNKYHEVIAAEIQLFGGNTFVRPFRNNTGVLYREVLTDVCDKMKVNYNEKSSTELIEMNLLMKISTDAIQTMNKDDLKKIVEELNLKTTNFTPEAVAAALQGAINISGFAAYKVALIVANAVTKAVLGRGLSLVANAGLARLMGVYAGPIGLALTGIWTLKDLAGPAYRITIPAVIHVAFLRRKMNYG